MIRKESSAVLGELPASAECCGQPGLAGRFSVPMPVDRSRIGQRGTARSKQVTGGRVDVVSSNHRRLPSCAALRRGMTEAGARRCSRGTKGRRLAGPGASHMESATHAGSGPGSPRRGCGVRKRFIAPHSSASSVAERDPAKLLQRTTRLTAPTPRNVAAARGNSTVVR